MGDEQLRTLRGVAWLVACVCVASPAVAEGGPATSTTAVGLASPTRERGQAERARAIASAVDRRLQRPPRVASPIATVEVATALKRGDELFASGQLDEAAATLDLALERGAHDALRVDDPAALIGGHVTRIAIALARGENARATALLERIVRWDPRFDLTPAEDRPGMREALEEVRARLGAVPPLDPAEFEVACRDLPDLIVTRGLRGGQLEVTRIESCRRDAQAIVGPDADPASIAASLVAAPLPAGPPPAVEHRSSSRSLWRSPWLWGAVGVGAAATAGIVVWRATRPDGNVDVVPHF